MQVFRGFLVWFIVTLFVVYAFCLNTASAVFAEAIKVNLHASDLGALVATAAFILGFACMQIPSGYLLDHFNAKVPVTVGIFLLAFGNWLASVTHQLTIFTLANLVQGMGASFAFIAAAVLTSQWFSARIFPILFGLTQTLSCIFAGILHYYFTLALHSQDWSALYQKLALFGFILGVITLFVVRSPIHYIKKEKLSFKKELSSVLKNRQILLCSLAAGLSFGVLLAYAGLWYIQIQHYYSVDNLNAVFISALIFFGIGLGTPILGYLSNQVQSRVMVVHITLVTGTMALLLGIYLPHYAWNTYLITKVVSFLIGFLLSGSMLFYTMVSELATDATRGVAISVLNMTVFLFNTLFLFLPHLFVTTSSHAFFTSLWVLPFSILGALLLLYFIRDTLE